MKCQFAYAILLTSTINISSASEVTDSINSFADKLYNVLSTNAADLVFSPFSAHSALSLTYLGTANETAETFERVLDLPELNETIWGYKEVMATLKSVENVTVETANKIYVMTDYALKREFRTIAESYFWADVENINFSDGAQAADEINGWCKRNTHDKIDRLVTAGDLNGDTRALVLNAVYFKGNWSRQFDKELTHRAEFHTSVGKSVRCDMMYQPGGQFEYGEDESLDAKMLKMRYQDQRFSMIVFLPNRVDGLEKLEASLHQRNLSSFKLETSVVDVSMPKFKFVSTVELNDPLSKLGLDEIFSFSADFSNLLESSSETLKIDKVLQKAFIEVNEEGSETAASTVVEITSRFGDYNDIFPRSFNADRPFIFYITAELDGNGHDGGNAILFMGKIRRPATTTTTT